MEHGSKTRLVTALILAAVFSSGVLLGFAADSNLGAEPANELVPTESATAEEESAEDSTPRRRGMYMQVDPNEEQLARIDEIVAEHSARVDALDEELRSEFRAARRLLVQETREAIKGALTAEQAGRYQAILDEWDERRAAEREEAERENGNDQN